MNQAICSLENVEGHDTKVSTPVSLSLLQPVALSSERIVSTDVKKIIRKNNNQVAGMRSVCLETRCHD